MENAEGMSTVHRHSLKKARQSHRMRSPQLPPAQRRKSSFKSAHRSVRRLRRSRWFWLLLVFLLVFIGLGTWYYGFKSPSNPSATGATARHVQATPTVTNWQTLRTLSGSDTGNTTKKLDTFTVSSNWQITWSCQGTNGVDDWLYIAIYNPDGTLYNAGAQVTCIAAKQVVGSVQETKAGQFYLTVDANTSWTIQIQVPR